MHLSKFTFVQSALIGQQFAMTLVHSVRPTSWKHWPKRLNSNGPLSFCASDSWVKIFDLKLGSVYARKYSVPNQAWSGATWPVISLVPFSKETLIRLVWHAIGTEGCPASIPVKLGRILHFDKIRHCHDLYFFVLYNVLIWSRIYY